MCAFMATMKEISGHFGVTVQTMTEYVKKHLDVLNKDGEHAAMKAGRWVFDAVAVERLEDLRGWGTGGVMEEVESKKLKQAAELIRDLQNQLVQASIETKAAQNEKAATWQKYAETQKEMRLLSENTLKEREELATLRERTSHQTQKMDEQQKEIEAQKQEIKKLREQLEAGQKRLQEESDRQREQQERLARASIWQRLTGKW